MNERHFSPLIKKAAGKFWNKIY